MCTRPASTYSGVTSETVVVCETFRMKRSIARIIPVSTARVRSANTVSAKVTTQTLMSILVSFSSSGISPQSPTL